MTECIVYDRSNVDILGTTLDVEGTECIDRQGHRCFNCGSPQHIVTQCTERLNRPLIALSRAMFEFFRDPGQSEPERIHEYAERKAQRFRLSEAFVAGSIHGELLRDALGIRSDAGDEGGARELPWLWPMLDWGYPPGWVSEEDPRLKVRARIEGESVWTDDLDATVIIDNSPQTSSSVYPSANAEEPTTPTVPEQTDPPRRWAHYPTSLFSSDHLAVYTGVPLPPLMHDGLSPASTGVRTEPQGVVPPWRRPGAFSAFGPAGWQEYARRLESSVHVDDGNVDDGDTIQSDMDLSD